MESHNEARAAVDVARASSAAERTTRTLSSDRLRGSVRCALAQSQELNCIDGNPRFCEEKTSLRAYRATASVDAEHRPSAKWKRRIRSTLIIVAVGFLVWASPFARWLAHLSYDLPFALRSGPVPEQVLVVYMDDESRSRLGQPVEGPWDRALHVQLLNALTRAGARTVVFDVLFDQPGEISAVDEDFAKAIRTHGKVVLGASCKYTGGDGEPIVGHLTVAAEPLGSSAPWGVAELPLDSDGTIRRHFYDEVYTNLAWQAAAVFGGAPGNRSQERWIRYYGPSGTIPHASYHEVLDPDSLAPGMISNKVVFIGMAPIITYQGSRSFDEFETPYSHWTGKDSTGVEIQATACLNLLRGDWLTRLPVLAELGMIVLLGVGLGFATTLTRPMIAFITIGGLALVMVGAGMVLASLGPWWFNWAAISFVEAPLAVTILFLTRPTAQLEKDRPVRNSDQAALRSASPPAPEIPDHELLRPFASGSYGQVWLARTVLGAYRAVKIVQRDAFEDAAPFDREFRGIQAFEPVSRTQEGFVDILQVGRREEAGYFYYVMELADDRISGQTITPDTYSPRTVGSDLTARGQIPCQECVETGLQLAGALQKLHEAGLVHRDIKPSNIIFVKGRPKLADIGLVATTSEAKSFVGTQGFLAPEGPGAPPADIYSLGKVLYEMAMGRDRCRYPELPTTLAEDPDRDRLLALNDVLIQACETEVSARYASAAEMRADLERLSVQWQAGQRRND